MPWRSLILVLGLMGLATGRLTAQNTARDIKVRNDRKAFQESRDWIYNDLAGGIRAASRAGSPGGGAGGP